MTDLDPTAVALTEALATQIEQVRALEQDRDRWRQLAHDRSAALLDALKKLDATRA